jgi:putative transposase
LTVRDLYSRYGLAVALLRTQSIAATRREFGRLFAQHGLPERIRCDNGSPFGGGGPTGLTRLSAWWIKLGIEVEFITPGRPCENGAHEQRHYNHQRPHEALGMKRPADLLEKNRRRRPQRLRVWKYPQDWERCWVKGNGEISWGGLRRFVGEAFVRDYVGLKPLQGGVWRVHFGPVVVGELHEKERGSIRMATYARAS